MIAGLLLGWFSTLQDERLRPPSPDTELSVKADVWFASMRGSGRLDKWFGRSGSEKESPRLSFDREGELDEIEPAPGFDLYVRWGEQKQQTMGVRLQYRHAAWSESGDVDQSFVVDGTTIPAGSSFRSRLQKDYGSLQFVGGFKPLEVPLDIRFWAGCHFHREVFKMSTSPGELRDGAGGLNATFGIQAEVRPVEFLFAWGELSWTGGFGVPESEGVLGGGVILDRFRLEAGYRHLWAVWSSPAIRLSIGGAFVGASVTF